MADTYTTNLNLTKPEPGAAEDTWGISLNADLDALDAIFSSSGTQINLNPNQINFADNKKAIFGTGGGLEIYHDGNDKIESSSSFLILEGSNIILRNNGGTEDYAKFFGNGAVELYSDNSKKLATTSTGIDVTGVITTDGLTTSGNINFGDNDKAVFGAGSDLEIYHNANTSFITESGSSNLKIGGENLYLQNTAHNENYLAAIANGAVTLYYNNSAKLATTSAGIDVSGIVENDGLRVDNTDSIRPTGDTSLITISGGNATNSGANYTLFGGTHATLANIHRWRIGGSEAMRIDSSQNLMVGKTSVGVSTTGSEIRADGQVSIVREYATPLYINRKSSDGNVADFRKDNSTFGTISNSGTNLIISGFGTNKSGLYFGDNALFPVKNGSLSNSTIGFGSPNYRFTDLYLSGTAYVGTSVGIGTSSPAVAIHAEDASAQSGRTLRLAYDSTYYFDIEQLGAGGVAYNAVNASSGGHRWEHGGSEKMRLDFSGNLGIGTTSPTGKIHVKSGSTPSIAQLIIGYNNTSINYFDANTHIFRNGSSQEKARIDSSGRLGIGRTPTTNLLEVADTIKLTNLTAGEGFIGYNTNGVKLGITAADSVGGGMKFEVGLSERARIDGFGNLLVGGTTTPDTNGISIETSASSGGLSIISPTTGRGDIFFGDTADLNIGQIRYAHSDNSMTFRTNAGDRVVIDSSGNLDVSGTVTSDGLTVDGIINKNSDYNITHFYKADGSTRLAYILFRDDNPNYFEYNDTATQPLYFINNNKKVLGLESNSDISFYNTAGTSQALFFDASTERLGIGTTSPTTPLHVYHATTDTVANFQSGDNSVAVNFTALDNSMQIATSNTDGILKNNGAGSLRFFNNGSERARIDGSGNFMVGTTDSFPGAGDTNTGVSLTASGSAAFSRDGFRVVSMNRNTSNGDILEFRKDGSTVGSIGVAASDNLWVGASASGHAGLYFDIGNMVPMSANLPADNVIDLGSPLARFDDIYATNATIQTSDRNEKQDIEELSEAETRVAVAAKGLLKKFKFKSAVEEKGDEARIHFGIIAQDLQDAFTAEGLDASDYAMFCSNTWTDDDGVEQTRLGVRYSELLAFIIAAI